MAAGALPPSHTSSGLASRGPTWARSTVKNSPENETSSPVSSSRSSCSDSSNRAARRPGGAGNWARSPRRAGCRPNTGSTRLGARAASEVSCLATRTGLRPGSTATPKPTFSRVVRASAQVIPTKGSTSGPYTISLSHSESTPSRSSWSTTAGSSSGRAAGPGLIPIRIFMFPSDHEDARGTSAPAPDAHR